MQVQKISLSQQVQNEIQEMILNGTFRVGEYLPSESELSNRFNVSRTTTRDAISALVEKGFLERQHGKGIFVIDNSKNVAADSFRNMVLRESYTFAEFMETRNMIETQMARFAAIRATKEQIERMDGYIRKMRRKDIGISTYADYDVAFHMELAVASQNRLLIAVYTAIEPLMKQIVEHVVKSGGKVENDSGFHAAIWERIKARDPEGAQDKMKDHLTASERMFQDSIEPDTGLDQVLLWTSQPV